MKKAKVVIPSSYPKDKGRVYQEAIDVDSFHELQEKMAQLSCVNKNYVVFYRGQSFDFKSGRRRSSFYPSLYRGNLSQNIKEKRWRDLEDAMRFLVVALKYSSLTKNDYETLVRKPFIQMSILQHYDVVATPMIDVTQSLRVACSFALLGDSGPDNDSAFVYAFALPYPQHRISIDSEEYISIVRLISIAPANAVRIYRQEAFLVAEDVVQKGMSRKKETDLGRRLIAKFRIHNNPDFWGNDQSLKKEDLLPDKGDKIFDICQAIKTIIQNKRARNINAFEKVLRELHINKEDLTEKIIVDKYYTLLA